MSRSIEVSPKHGVNPTIPVCFFCGKDKNQIALLGRVRERDKRTGRAVPGSDVEVPSRMVLDYEPCDECAKNMSTGVTLLGVTMTPPTDNRPSITAQGGESVYPTGSWCVIKPEAAQRMFNINQTFQNGNKLFLEQSILSQIIEGAED